MKLNRTDAFWDRSTRNDINENWDIIEGNSRKLENDFKNVVDSITDEVVGQLVDSAKLDWEDPVDTYNDLPANAEVGETRMVRDTGKVYRFNGSAWVEIQQIDAGPVNEVDSRLTAQLADIENLENYELNSKGRSKKGIAVFTSDDGRIEEYTIAKTIFESEGVPQTIFLVPNWLDTPNFLTREQALELQNELDWEVGSHSKTHPAPFPNVSDSQAEIEFRDSKQELENMGFNVDNYSYVGGNYGQRERLLARKYYRSARCSDAGYHEGINYAPLNTYELKTFWIDPSAYFMYDLLHNKGYSMQQAITATLNKAKELIDEASEKSGLIIFSTHFTQINTPELQQLYRDVIRYAKSKIRVMNLRDALNEMGNIVDVGDHSETGFRANGDSHLVIGANGLISGSVSVTKPNEFTPLSHFDDFPIGITYTPIHFSYSEGAPEGLSGLLVNYRTDVKNVGMNYQEYHIYGQKRVYVRQVNSDRTFAEWQNKDNVLSLNDPNRYTPLTPMVDFPAGVSIALISTNNPGISGAPKGLGGTLVTYKPITGTSQIGYVYQEYKVFNSQDVYKRTPTSPTAWGTWTKKAEIVMPSDNNFAFSTPITSFEMGQTFSIIFGDNPEIGNAPEGTRGTLETVRITGTSSPGYSYQKYYPAGSNSIYKRHPASNTTWGAWAKVTV